MSKRVHSSKKGHGDYVGRPSRSKKRKPPTRSHKETAESASTSARSQSVDENVSSTSADKIRESIGSDGVPESDFKGYRILDLWFLLTFLQTLVKCKECDKDISFSESGVRGLGFRVDISCACGSKSVPSSKFVDKSFEINRRFQFAMRLLGVGYSGLRTFCGIMDLPSPISRQFYGILVTKIRDVCKSVAELFMKRAAAEELNITREKGPLADERGISVSGDGTWRTRGHTSLIGVASLIGFYLKKVLDVVIKSLFCKACETQQLRLEPGSEELLSWEEDHQEKCTINHSGSSGKMEVDAVTEMFM